MPEFPIEDVITQFTIVVLAALLVQLLFERTRIPGIIGLLLLGMAIGPGGAALLPTEPVVELFGSLGLLYIMFLAGAEIDLDHVRSHKREAISFGFLAFVLSFVPAIGVALLFGLDWPGALLIGAALSSHTLVAYPMISRMGLASRPAIVTATGGTLLTDTAALLVLVLVIQTATGDGLWGVATTFGLLALLAAGGLILVPRLARTVLSSSHTTMPERALFLVAVLLVLALAAEYTGGEDILGAFLAGVCLNRALHSRKELHENLQFVGHMLFVPFFFVETGMRLELDALAAAETWWMALALAALVFVSKSAAAWLVSGRYGYGSDGRLAVASLSFPQAAATLAVVYLGLELDLVDAVTVDAVIVVIFITCLVGPMLTWVAANRMQRQGSTPGDADHRSPSSSR
jgi:Kef-type K+ transport system membrane component KefB